MLEYERRLIEDNMYVVGYVVRKLMNKFNIPREEYEDYCQSGYLILCSKVHKYDGSVEFKTFADKVLRNGFIDLYRTKHDIDSISLEASLYDDNEKESELMNFICTDCDMESEAVFNVTRDILKKYIRKLKRECRANTVVKGFEALELRMQGYTGKEIADMFNVPDNSLRSWMSKAKKILIADDVIKKLLCD